MNFNMVLKYVINDGQKGMFEGGSSGEIPNRGAFRFQYVFNVSYEYADEHFIASFANARKVVYI